MSNGFDPKILDFLFFIFTLESTEWREEAHGNHVVTR